ncbi:MAG: PSD1 domain-containing protein [Pirellulaceae bacterium]|nr:PSD1 domain-containing protein [Pirellulaceae bacterium]
MPALQKLLLPLFISLTCASGWPALTTIVHAQTASNVDEWFEREVRPLLAERCLSCHSSSLEAPKANLKLDRRELAMLGGDSGPAILSGQPKQSLLIHAVRGQGMDRMPPDKPLTKPEIATLERWIELGAPWPEREVHSPASGPDWLKDRAQSHWSWQALRDSQPPTVKHSSWPKRPLDAYIRHKLESLAVSPSASATPHQLLRRLAFDLTGLPPSEEQWSRFAQHKRTDTPEFEELYLHTLDELLSSPQFGVTWGRHWFDLVRYCETLGHEFDYPVRHAWRYRDAVIDAFNGDLSYATFVNEHIAGDTVRTPRRHPLTDVNQSLTLTGWWWMGEGLHAPVDIWGDEATRIDNQIDVYSKVFLGLTVACARCHDHKFDAISATDYTSLVGIMQSSRRTYAPDDPHGKIAQHNRHLVHHIQSQISLGQQSQAQSKLQAKPQTKPESDTGSSASSSDSSHRESVMQWLDQIVERMRGKLDEARRIFTAGHPLHSLLLLAECKTEEELAHKCQTASVALAAKADSYAKWYAESVQLADFSKGLPAGWYVEAADPELAQLCARPFEFMPLDPLGILPTRPDCFASHTLGKQQQLSLRSPTFDVTHPIVALRMRGKSAQSTVMVDNYFMIEFHGLLFGDLRKPIDQPNDWGWVVHGGDLNKYLGHPGYISIDDDENSWFELSEVRLCNSPPPEPVSPLSPRWLSEGVEQGGSWRDALKSRIVDELLQWSAETALKDQRLHRIELIRSAVAEGVRYEVPLPIELAPGIQRDVLETEAAATPAPTRVLAMHEGTPRHAPQAIRGNPHKRGELTPRCDLQALGGEQFLSPTSSGRSELATSLTSTKHPLASRVMVNRVWLHLFGQGLVDSPDNFGLLGGAPSHVELLDYLTLRFIEHDWSLKWLVREICASGTYQLSSLPTAEQLEVDPTAKYLSHRAVRRLSAEKLRDSLLMISGSLDRTHGGESVKVHLTEQMSGRGRPGQSGPLDGAGRRAVYVEVRRNFLDPFLVAFDQPPPATTVGKRNLSNVPAQALSLLNDPLVHEMSRRWSQQVAGQLSDPAARVKTMFVTAFAREPSAAELEACLGLASDGSADSLRELAHVLMCAKEFQYLQ